MPPHVLAHVERILAERNVGGMVPEDIADALLDEMASVNHRAKAWSCESYRTYGIHAFCHHCHSKETP